MEINKRTGIERECTKNKRRDFEQKVQYTKCFKSRKTKKNMGLELASLKLISFKNEQTSDLLKNLKVKIERRGDREVILNEFGEVEKCKICEKELFTDNVGHISHGSVDLICDNPACIICHLVSKNH